MAKDLRVIKSRLSIESAFITLVEMKGFTQVTITEIAEKAMVNRNTIYLNYGSKEGILESIIQNSFQKYFGDVTPDLFKVKTVNKRMLKELFSNLFNIIDENIELYRILLIDSSSSGYIETEANKIKGYVVSSVKPLIKNEIYLSYIISGLWGIITSYIIYAKGTREDNIEILTDLIMPNIKKVTL